MCPVFPSPPPKVFLLYCLSTLISLSLNAPSTLSFPSIPLSSPHVSAYSAFPVAASFLAPWTVMFYLMLNVHSVSPAFCGCERGAGRRCADLPCDGDDPEAVANICQLAVQWRQVPSSSPFRLYHSPCMLHPHWCSSSASRCAQVPPCLKAGLDPVGKAYLVPGHLKDQARGHQTQPCCGHQVSAVP